MEILCFIFEIDATKIRFIGDGYFTNNQISKETPKADWEVTLSKKEKIRVEIQYGSMGTNDIKQYKVLEAKQVFRVNKIHSLVIHFDWYNMQVAFVKLDEIEDGSENWMTRINFDEGVVWNIDQNFFVWNLEDVPLPYQRILDNYYA